MTDRIKREWRLLGREVKYSRRSANELFGRFGGGWNWKIGVQWGKNTVLFSLLVSELRIDRKRQRSQ